MPGPPWRRIPGHHRAADEHLRGLMMKISPGIWIPFTSSTENIQVRPSVPGVSVRPSVFTRPADDGTLQTRRVVNLRDALGPLFPSVIKKKREKNQIHACQNTRRPARLLPRPQEYKAPSHCRNLWPPGEIWVIRAWPTNTQKNSRNSNNSEWKSWVKFIKQIREKSISVWRRRRYITCLVDGVQLWNIWLFGICEFWNF